MRLSSILCFSLTSFVSYTGSIQAQLLPEREDSLQGPVKSIQIEQAILARHLDQWAAGERKKVDATTYDQHWRKTVHLHYEIDGSLKKRPCTPTAQRTLLSRESTRVRVSPVSGLCLLPIGKNSVSRTVSTRQMAAYRAKPSQY